MKGCRRCGRPLERMECGHRACTHPMCWTDANGAHLIVLDCTGHAPKDSPPTLF